MKNDDTIWKFSKRERSASPTYICSEICGCSFSIWLQVTLDKELIKDSIHDLFFDLIRTRANLGKTDNIRFYLLCSFRRKLFRNMKKSVDLVLSDENQLFRANIIYSIEEEIVDRENLSERERVIKDALQVLSQKQREILYYRYTCEFEYDQICELMSLKYDSARKQVFRALKALKERLAAKFNL